MPHPTLSVLFCALGVLLVLAAFFAGSETALMSLNRYRLRHQAKAGNRGARLAEALLARPDRLIGLILFLSTMVNVTAPTLVERDRPPAGRRLSAGVRRRCFSRIVLLIFCEVAPKTYGALHPARLALPAAYVYTPLLWVLYPFVWATNLLANGVLRLLGVSREQASNSLSTEELRTVVAEAGAMIPKRHQQMLVSLLDLEKATVEDIMVPRVEIVGIDVDDPWETILEQLRQSQHTRLPVFEGDIEHIVGVLHMKRVVHELARGRWDREKLIEAASTRDAYFVPSGTPLNTQLLNFQRDKRRMAFVVDEYGDIQGLVTLEDILEEIVGEFTTDPATMMHKDLHREADGSFVANASTTIRALNRSMRWNLPTRGPEDLERPDRRVPGDHSRAGHHAQARGLHARGRADRRQRHQDGAHPAARRGDRTRRVTYRAALRAHNAARERIFENSVAVFRLGLRSQWSARSMGAVPNENHRLRPRVIDCRRCRRRGQPARRARGSTTDIVLPRVAHSRLPVPHGAGEIRGRRRLVELRALSRARARRQSRRLRGRIRSYGRYAPDNPRRVLPVNPPGVAPHKRNKKVAFARRSR